MRRNELHSENDSIEMGHVPFLSIASFLISSATNFGISERVAAAVVAAGAVAT